MDTLRRLGTFTGRWIRDGRNKRAGFFVYGWLGGSRVGRMKQILLMIAVVALAGCVVLVPATAIAVVGGAVELDGLHAAPTENEWPSRSNPDDPWNSPGWEGVGR